MAQAVPQTVHRLVIALLGSLGLAPMALVAAVNPVGPFSGDFHDNFNQFTNTNALQVLDVFNSHGVIRNLTQGGAIKVEFSSSLNGDLVVPISGMMIGQLGIADWEFNQPLSKFGGYWENNSGADDATVTFFDSTGSLLGTYIASIPVSGQQWVWHGWESDTPFTRVHVVGNGLINGFIWYDNMEISVAVPEPAGAIPALAGLTLTFLRGRARRRSPYGT